ncbi:dihydrofolate reductase family protein [Dermacoccaceae bacterium W4C1]
MRALLPAPAEGEADDLVARAYHREGPWLRWNMIATADGALTGADGLSRSINNPADHRVFGYLRAWADVVIVGAATAAAEGYTALTGNRWREQRHGRRPAPLLVVCSSSGELPETLVGSDPADVRAVTLGPQGPAGLVRDLAQEGLDRVLLEGGPRLAARFVQAGVVDELCLTIVPLLGGGERGRILTGPDLDRDVELAGLLEEDGTLLTRWHLTGLPS